MQDRRKFMLMLTAGLVTMAMVITPVIADEFFGIVTNVDLEGKKLTVLAKDGEVEIKTTDSTEVSSTKGEADLEELQRYVKKRQEAGKKGGIVKITHENKVASKILIGAFKKKEAN
jgi:hypothetical protein